MNNVNVFEENNFVNNKIIIKILVIFIIYKKFEIIEKVINVFCKVKFFKFFVIVDGLK